jgi:hypothetical protein
MGVGVKHSVKHIVDSESDFMSARTMMYSEVDKVFIMNTHHVPLRPRVLKKKIEKKLGEVLPTAKLTSVPTSVPSFCRFEIFSVSSRLCKTDQEISDLVKVVAVSVV